MDVVYNASNNELVRTKTLVKNAIVQVDATLFKQWCLQRYGVDLSKKKKSERGSAVEEVRADIADFPYLSIVRPMLDLLRNFEEKTFEERIMIDKIKMDVKLKGEPREGRFELSALRRIGKLADTVREFK